MTFCQTLIYYPHQDPGVDTIFQPYSESSFFTCVPPLYRDGTCAGLCVHHWTQDTGILSTTGHPVSPTHASSLTLGNQPTRPSSVSNIVSFPKCGRNAVVQCVTFWDWLLSAQFNSRGFIPGHMQQCSCCQVLLHPAHAFCSF